MKVGDITVMGCENCSTIKYGDDYEEEEIQTDHEAMSIEHVERHLAYTHEQFISLLTMNKDTRPPGTITTWKCTVCGAISTQHKVVKND